MDGKGTEDIHSCTKIGRTEFPQDVDIDIVKKRNEMKS